MTEKEKAALGLLYDANYDRELMEERERAKVLTWQYNQTNPAEKEQREKILRELLAKLGNGLIEQPFYCDYGYNIEIGRDFYANVGCVMLDAARITIGNHVFLGPNVGLYTAGHPLDAERRNQGLEYARPIVIEDDVWIGGNAVVLPGVRIGKGAIIGAGSVVTRDIPPNSLAVGNPCRVLKSLD